MYGRRYKRLHSRWNIETPILFSRWKSKDRLDAKMRNISESGMYFESGLNVKPSSEVYIWTKNHSLQKRKDVLIYDFYRSRVRWSKPLEMGEGTGIGVQHISRTRGIIAGPEFQCSLCDKKIPVSEVHFVNNFLYLCPRCYAEFEHCTGAGKSEIIRILEGNVF